MFQRVQQVTILAVPLALLTAMYVIVIEMRAQVAAPTYVLHIEMPDISNGDGAPVISGPADSSRPLVVIDPGHGGFDPGAGQGDIKEKDIALSIARAIRDRIVAGGGIRVALTRERDRFVTLPERPELARALDADLFISVHADSAENEGARGSSVYVLSDKGSSEAAARFAARENQADWVNGISLAKTSDSVGAILLDLSQREAVDDANLAASLFLRELNGKVPLHRGYVESAALAVLKAPDVPSVLLETGYISNIEDAKFLESDAGRQTIADAAANAIRVYFARKAGR